VEVYQNSGATVTVPVADQLALPNISPAHWEVRHVDSMPLGRVYVDPESMPEMVYVSRDVVIQLSSDVYSVTGARGAWEHLSDRDVSMALSLAELAVRRLRDEQLRRDQFGRYAALPEVRKADD
jgi:hypothetical protein